MIAEVDLNIPEFVCKQLSQWPMAAENHRVLDDLITRQVEACGRVWTLQHNPHRAVSAASKVDAQSIAQRRCFLCKENRPDEQFAVDLGDYEVLVNPFPIFPEHLTIAAKEHVAQTIDSRVKDIVEISRVMPGRTVFYNGARCGASAPDHLHFQSVPSQYLPIWQDVERALDDSLRGKSCAVVNISPKIVRIASQSLPSQVEFIADVLSSLPKDADESEPKVNMLCRFDGQQFETLIVPRRAHRPDFYGQGQGQMLISPGTIDVSGVIVVARREDFKRIDAAVIESLISQIGME